MGSSEQSPQSSASILPLKGLDNTGMLLFPGEVLRKLKLALVGYTFYFSKGSDGPLHGPTGDFSQHTCLSRLFPVTHTVPPTLIFLNPLLSLGLQIPTHPLRLNSVLYSPDVLIRSREGTEKPTVTRGERSGEG